MNGILKLVHVRSFVFGLLIAGTLNLAAKTHAEESSLYQQLGGLQAITQVVDVFIELHPSNPTVNQHFEHTNMSRFRDKFIAFICSISDGPCEYTGDTMLLVHGGMNLNETEFNGSVNLLIKAMDDVGVSIGVRNQLLARLARLRSDIIYQ
ncbi:MAG: group 1 truncated hemoglobin [Pseudomonadales bacterium]